MTDHARIAEAIDTALDDAGIVLPPRARRHFVDRLAELLEHVATTADTGSVSGEWATIRRKTDDR